MFNDKNKFQRPTSKPKPNGPAKYESESTIKSNEEQNCMPINVPNYSVYSSGAKDEVQKVLIDKVQLISFAQRFAQEKISLQNTVSRLQDENKLMGHEIQRLRHQNETLKSMTESIKNHNTTQYYEAVETLKSKLKIQFQKRLQAERDLHTIEGAVFEIKKKNEFLMDKMKYQEDQVQRCEQLLKIKEDIIQNLEWQKANTAKSNQKKQKSIQKVTNNYPSVFHNKNQANQILDLSQIKSSDQPGKPINFNNSLQLEGNQSLQRNKPRYIINKRSNEQDSIKKVNISIHKKSSNQSSELKNSSTEKPEQQKSKPKGIVLKKHLNTSLNVGGNSETQLKEKQYLKTIVNLQSEIETLKAQLTQRSFPQTPLKVSEEKALKPSIQNNQVTDNNAYQLMEKKYNMMKQKCLLLQGQIQKTIRKYVITEERNNQLENLINSLNSASSKPTFEQSKNLEVDNQVTKPGLSIQDLVTPQFRESKFSNNFFHKDKRNNENQWNHSQFNQISLPDYQIRQNSHLLNTFEKNNKDSKLSSINERSYDRNELSRQFNEIQDVSEIVCRNQESMAMGDTLDL